jgi:hypothetical protein
MDLDKLEKQRHQVINIVCVKWGTKYGPEYVNRLARAVQRHTTVEYQFWCMTEDSTGLLESVNVIPLRFANRLDSWWNKLVLFDSANGITPGEQIFYIDLDTLIVDNIDYLLTDQVPDIVMLQDFYHGIAKSAGALGSGLMSWRHGNYQHIWDKFIRSPEEAIQSVAPHGDQQFIANHIDAWYHWQDLFPDSVVSFKVHCREGLPSGARIVCYHGRPSIPDSATQANSDYKWRIAPQPWVLEHWKD